VKFCQESNIIACSCRLFTAAFLHADWNHLLLNMVSLYLFGRHVEMFLGIVRFLAVYLAAIVGGSFLSLCIHRHHEYHAYGASGGVCGVIFSYIFLFPGSSIFMFPMRVSIPAWLYAILFFIGSFLALKRQADHIGHDAHLGGAIIGLWTTTALEPWIVSPQPKLFLAISTLSVVLFVYLVKNPLFLPLSSYATAKPQPKTKSRKLTKVCDETELDAVLEKKSPRAAWIVSVGKKRPC
jgi:hypothetical protein